MKHKKVISIALCCLLTITLLVTKPIKAKAEIDVRQSLIATLVISLINMGINVTTDVIEPYIVKWAINAQDYAEELLNQFDNVKETLIVGFKTLTLAKRIQSDLLRQGLKNNGSITINVNTKYPNYITGTFQVGQANITYTKNSLLIDYPKLTQVGASKSSIRNMTGYNVIKLKTGNNTYNIPTITYDSTDDSHINYSRYAIPFKNREELITWLGYINDVNYYSIPYNPKDIFPSASIKYPNGHNNIATGSNNYSYNNTKNYEYMVIYNELLLSSGLSASENYQSYTTWQINLPTQSDIIDIVDTKENTVTAGTIDTANWSSVNNNYTYEMVIESNNEVVKSNQALIDAVNNNTQSITQSQVIDTTTQTSVEDIKTNVWGISSLLEGIKATFQTLVKPITDVFNKTYTLEEINTLSWVNVMNELVTTIDTGVGNIIPYYQNYVGNYLQGISHPQANILTTTVNDILVNTNLSWAVYAISVILLVKGVIL